MLLPGAGACKSRSPALPTLSGLQAQFFFDGNDDPLTLPSPAPAWYRISVVSANIYRLNPTVVYERIQPKSPTFLHGISFE